MAYGGTGGESMSSIAIYMEGGGDSAQGKAALRQGMDAFLEEIKSRARKKGWRWKLVSCGGRDQAMRAFFNSLTSNPDTHAILLVDSEDAVTGTKINHLIKRDKWNLSATEEDCVHLMSQVMETWLIADPGTLENYYGNNFHSNSLPKNKNLEQVTKPDIYSALESATKDTTKGRYHNIHHAKDLLGLISPDKVRKKCSHCDKLFKILDNFINK